MYWYVCISGQCDSKKERLCPVLSSPCTESNTKNALFFNKTLLTFSGLKHPLSGAYVTVCPTKPRWLYILGENDVYISIQTIHTDTFRYIQIHTDTYTYIHPAISVRMGFSGAAAVARDTTARHYLPRSSQTGLGAGLPSAKCVWITRGRRRGCTLPPPTRAARAVAPNRVLGWVPDDGKKWSGACPGVP